MSCCFRLLPAARRMDQISHNNADEVQDQHWRCKHTHGQHVRRGRNDGRNDEDNQDGIANVFEQKFRVHDPEEREKHDQDRQLKGDPEAEDHSQKEICVFIDFNQRVKVFVEGKEKIERAGKDPAVSEVGPSQKKANRGDHERRHIAFFMFVKSGRDEFPYLIEHKGRGDDASRHKTDFQIQIKAVNGIVIIQLRGQVVPLQGKDNRLFHVAINLLVEAVSDKKTANEIEGGADDPLTQLLQMFKEGHAGEFSAF